jgi:methanogenic corrinoid protein MtbC1
VVTVLLRRSKGDGMSSFGSNLKEKRKELKISQKQLAEAVGVGQTTIANYENDLRYPNPVILSKLADVLSISLDSLLNREKTYQEPQGDLEDYIDEFIQMVFRYEEDKAIKLVMDLVKQGHDVIDIYLKFLKETLYRVGNMWESGEVSIPMEHHITYFIDKVLILLSPYIEVDNKNGKTALFIAPGNENHLIGLKIVKEIFKKYGWRTLYIGKSVPWTSLTHWIKHHKAELVVISTTIDQNLNQVEAIVNFIRSNTKAKVLLGGQAFDVNHQYIQQINPDYYTPNDASLLELLYTK